STPPCTAEGKKRPTGMTKPYHTLFLLLLSLAWSGGLLAAPSAMGCLKIVNKDNAMLWENHCGHAILVAFCSPNEGALEHRCGQGKAAHNPFYTDQFTIAAGGVQAR